MRPAELPADRATPSRSVATVLFATRDNLVRQLSAIDTDVPPPLAAAATLASGTLVVGGYARSSRERVARAARQRAARSRCAGICFGLSYVGLFEAYYRGRVTVVSPLVATESLWSASLLSALLIRPARARSAGASSRGALLIVAGGVLIGAFR